MQASPSDQGRKPDEKKEHKIEGEHALASTAVPWSAVLLVHCPAPPPFYVVVADFVTLTRHNIFGDGGGGQESIRLAAAGWHFLVIISDQSFSPWHACVRACASPSAHGQTHRHTNTTIHQPTRLEETVLGASQARVILSSPVPMRHVQAVPDR